MEVFFAFIDETFNRRLDPPLSSCTALLVPAHRYDELRIGVYRAIDRELQPAPRRLVQPSELHWRNFLPEATDERKLEVLRRLAALVPEVGASLCRVGYFVTDKLQKDFPLVKLAATLLTEVLQMRARNIVGLTLVAGAGWVLAGCASNSGVVPMGADRYMVSRQASTGFSGLGKLKAAALREADAYCRAQGKTMELLKSSESEPPYILGNYPRVEIEFTCH